MIEHVAEALWQSDSLRAMGRPRLVAWSDVAEKDKETFRISARAAIEALMEPTRKMTTAGMIQWTADQPMVEQIYQAMLRAALAPDDDTNGEKG